MKLSAVVALVTGKKNESKTDLTRIYQSLNNDALFRGLSKTYQAKEEEGEQLPPESKLLQSRVTDLLEQVSSIASDLYDVVASQEIGNQKSTANVEIDGQVIIKDVPVPYLLFLEKQFTDIITILSKLPVNDPSVKWSWDSDNQCYRSELVQTARTKKVPKVITKSPATPEHPAQVELFHEDVLAGYWSKVDFSGAISPKDRAELVERARRLKAAVVIAREVANSTDVSQVKVGANIFNYLFAPLKTSNKTA